MCSCVSGEVLRQCSAANPSDIHVPSMTVLPYSGYFSGGNIFVDMENFAGSWKKFRGFVYACTNERGSLHLYGNCFVDKYFVVYFSTTKSGVQTAVSATSA